MKWHTEKEGGKEISAIAEIGDFRLSIYRYAEGDDRWFMSCYGIFNATELGGMSLNDAKVIAAARLQLKLEKAIKVITNGT